MAPSMAALYSSPARRWPGRRPRSTPVESGQLGVRSPAGSSHSSQCCRVSCLAARLWAAPHGSVLLQPRDRSSAADGAQCCSAES